MKSPLIITFLLLIITLPIMSSAESTYVVSNSENWIDVYSTIHYANLQEKGSDFLTSTSHGALLLGDIKKENIIEVISSEDSPYVFHYDDMIIANDFKGAEEKEVDNANIELIEELDDIRNFIIVGDSYGYNSIAVAPYAIQTDSWVFIANRLTIQRIDSILSNRNINDILIYGYVDTEVRETLEKYNPEIINTGDRFQDNVEIVKKYLEIEETKQVLLTNGEFIEKELMLGTQPVLFTGAENVPDQIADYLKSSEIEIGVLVGNELMNAATNIRRTTGISVMVKFARGARSQGDGVSAVEGLDLFPLPNPTLNLVIQSAKYNRLSKQLEITYKSESNVPIYLRGTLTINPDSDRIRVGDADAIFITPENYKTLTYSIEDLNSEYIEVEVYTLFGESKTGLDMLLEQTIDASIISVLDKCEIEIKDVSYNKQYDAFKIKVKNIAEVDCWVNIELEELNVGYETKIVGTETPIFIKKGKTQAIRINEELNNNDLDKNTYVNLVAHYGEREEGLVHVLTQKYSLNIQLFNGLTYTIATLILIISILFLILWKRQKDNKDDFFDF